MMNEPTSSLIDCPICTAPVYKTLHKVQDGKLMKCTTCKLVSYSPRPSASDLEEYYSSTKYRKEYEVGEMTGSEFANNRYHQFIRTLLKYYPNLEYPGKLKLLDFGCGTGDFLLASKKDSWTVRGLEVADSAVDKANQLLGQTCVSSINFDSTGQITSHLPVTI